MQLQSSMTLFLELPAFEDDEAKNVSSQLVCVSGSFTKQRN